ncbi:MAG: hypothetical protein H0W81_07130 [Chloroflexi bacterium]|nr:hypothetical protein [Chloroflexota bacterium]
MALYLRLVAATARTSGPPVVQGQALFAIWHESNLVAATAAYRLRTTKRVISFSTRGFRGIVMNAMLESMGSGVVALPEESNRAEAAKLARELARIGREGSSLVVSCDGPTGPYRVAKPGVLIVSRESGIPIQPWAVAIRPPWRMNGRWDRHLVPVPFCRMRVEEGTPIRIAPREPLKPRLMELQAALDGVQALADRRMEARRRRTIGPS